MRFHFATLEGSGFINYAEIVINILVGKKI